MSIDLLPPAISDLLGTLLPDFILGFALFTSLSFAVLGRQFQQKRPAVAASAALGFALAAGLVWWEQANELSIRNLGPIAVGFAVLVLGFILYQSVKQIGGSWAGAGITLGACILVAQILEVMLPVNPQIMQTITIVSLILGVLAFVSHHHPSGKFPSIPALSQERPRDFTELFRDRHLSGNLTKNLRRIQKSIKHPSPDTDSSGIVLQLQKMLPAEGYLTQRMAQLRARAFQIRNGHVARLEETQKAFKEAPVAVRKKAAERLMARYEQMVGIDTRLERLEGVVTANEKQIRQLTQNARDYARQDNYQGLHDCIQKATALQIHNTRIFKLITHTESKLLSLVQKTINEVKHHESPKSS
ncbi:MAG TPA: hypothetical protein PKB02_07945 [Anaerohalosphaeraceae bacterium]|nr:hypothetical protein [Anaerohalosphaeraceae bacterium]